MGIHVLSARNLMSSVSHDPLYELEDLILQTCEGQLITLEAREITRRTLTWPEIACRYTHKVLERTIGSNKPPRLNLSRGTNVLLVVALCGADLTLLSSIPQWRQRFDVVAAYVFDAWSPEIYPKFTSQLDHLFVPMPEIMDLLQRRFRVPVSLLPFGADALGHGSGQGNRSIDLMSYGRIPQGDHRAFMDAFNSPGSEQLYFRSTPRSMECVPRTPYAHRRDMEDTALLYHLLRRSKLCLAYDTLQPGMRQFPHSFVTLRWFQGGAAGCAIVGKRPTTPLADELLDWEDATIELPDTPQGSVSCIQDLLQDTQRLEAIHRRNYLKNLERHDWRLRIRDLLLELQLPLPETLEQQLSLLKTQHRQFQELLPV